MLDVPAWLEAVVLGIIQGLTEFLPVSSSGHLVIAPYLLGWEQPPLAFGVALHVGTLLAVLTYFRRDLQVLAGSVLGLGAPDEVATGRRTVLAIGLGSIPAAILGLSLGEVFDDVFGDPRIAAVALFGTSALLLTAERITRSRTLQADARLAAGPGSAPGSAPESDSGSDAERDPGAHDAGRGEGSVTPRDALVIGLAQGLALMPGISRAGATIAAGMVRGLSRTAAARFSFLLSVPVIAGAGLLEAPALFEPDGFGAFSVPETLLGAAVAAASGFWAIRFLLRLLASDDLRGFARYVVLLGVVTLALSPVIGPPTVG